MLINRASLAETLDAITAAIFDGRTLAAGERGRAARWIASRQGLPAALLRVRDLKVTRALERADDGLMRCLVRAEDPRNGNPGLYCCGKCSVGLWRNLLAGGLDRHDERLRRGASHLRSMRDGEHQWRRFPFWYTVLALSEMDSTEARAELKYAAPVLERAAAAAVPSSARYARRRHELAVRTLNSL